MKQILHGFLMFGLLLLLGVITAEWFVPWTIIAIDWIAARVVAMIQ